ncbi:MAG: hypothetical protein WBW32_09425 [Luteibacter sp.]
MTVEQAVERLAPYLPALHGALVEAWTTWQQQTAPTFASSRRSRATVVHDIILTNIRRAVPSAVEQNVRNLVMFVFDDSIAIRIKKFDDELCPKNIPTRQVLSFRRQEDIDGLPSMHHLELGYVLDHLQTQISSIHLVCPSGKKAHAWSFDVGAYVASTRIVGAPGLVIPLLPERGEPEAKPVTFRRKSIGTEEQNEVNSDKS